MPNGHQPRPTASFTTHIRARSTSTISTLPQQLQQNIPACAQSCISTYIAQDYTCSTNDFSCLCSQYSSQGFTLGEIAFICLQLDCSPVTVDVATKAYNVCAAAKSAVPATYSTLTIPVATTTATVASSSSASEESSTTVVSTTHSSTTAVASSTVPYASVSGASVTSVPIASDSSTPAASSTTSRDSTALTSAQAVGVSIGAFSAIVIAISVVYLIACVKRRKAKKQKENRGSYDFVDEAPPRFSPFTHGSADLRGPLGGLARPRVELLSEKRNTEWPSQRLQDSQRRQQSHYQCHEKGINRSPRIGRSMSSASHESDCSMRTTSQLLPDRPQASSNDPPRPPPTVLRPLSVHSPATVFEEERSPQLPRAFMPGLPSHPAVHKTRHPHFATHYTRSPDQLRQPPLSLEIPRQASRNETIQALGAFPMPPTAVIRSVDDVYRSSSGAVSNANSSSTSLLNYYASPDSGSPIDLCSSTPIDEDMQVRRPAPAAITVTKPTYPPRAVRVSTASDTSRRTSFESTDPDEPTPPEEEDKRLTPVAESPIAAIRYPKVPRSSNQSVPRSPVYKLSPRLPTQSANAYSPQKRGRRVAPSMSPVPPDQQMSRGHTPTLSGSTLAAKRRGDGAAHDLERGLRIADSTTYTSQSHSRKNTHTSPEDIGDGDEHRQWNQRGSPLKGYGRVTTAIRREPAWPLTLDMRPEMTSPPLVKSPLWEPKLTPRREGDDLYLDISVATPLNAHFRR